MRHGVERNFFSGCVTAARLAVARVVARVVARAAGLEVDAAFRFPAAVVAVVAVIVDEEADSYGHA